jgi:hypothetical protein
MVLSTLGAPGDAPVLQPPATGAYYLAEGAVGYVLNQIQSNILQALNNVIGERQNPIVTAGPPREYFIYEEAQVYTAPAIFVIIQDMDLRSETVKGNHINAMYRIIVAAVVEDRVKDKVVVKAWRYQAALVQLLHEVSLTNSAGTLRLFSRVKRCSFSGIINLKNEKDAGAVFRKEVSLELQVEHIENLE